MHAHALRRRQPPPACIEFSDGLVASLAAFAPGVRQGGELAVGQVEEVPCGAPSDDDAGWTAPPPAPPAPPPRAPAVLVVRSENAGLVAAALVASAQGRLTDDQRPCGKSGCGAPCSIFLPFCELCGYVFDSVAGVP
jgi:hypothetical protein